MRKHLQSIRYKRIVTNFLKENDNEKAKFIKSVIFAGILGVSSPLLAEESGWFAGVQLGGGGTEIVYEHCSSANYSREKICSTDPQEQDFEGYQWGFLGGYKQFFTADFGLRYYGAFNVGKYSYNGVAYKVYNPNEIRASFSNKLDEYTFNFNVDILYNLVSSDDTNFGIFGGVSLGCVWHNYDIKDGIDAKYTEKGYKQVDKARKLDAGLNFGLRVNIAKRHGIELYSRFALLKQKANYAVIAMGRGVGADRDELLYKPLTLTNTQIRSLGIAYIFTF